MRRWFRARRSDRLEAEAQAEVCARHGLQPSPPEDMVAVALPTIGLMPIRGQRNVLEEGENVSWFIFCGEQSDADDFYQPLHTHHLREMLPQAVRYLTAAGLRFRHRRPGL